MLYFYFNDGFFQVGEYKVSAEQLVIQVKNDLISLSIDNNDPIVNRVLATDLVNEAGVNYTLLSEIITVYGSGSPSLSQRGDVVAQEVKIGDKDLYWDIPVVLDGEHNKIHLGETFAHFHDFGNIGTGTAYAVIEIPTGVYLHFLSLVDTYKGTVKVELFENPVYDSDGVEILPINRSRTSILTSSVVAYVDNTITTEGSVIDIFFSGTGKSIGGSGGRGGGELVLHDNRSYLVKLTGLASGSNPLIRLQYYYGQYTPV